MRYIRQTGRTVARTLSYSAHIVREALETLLESKVLNRNLRMQLNKIWSSFYLSLDLYAAFEPGRLPKAVHNFCPKGLLSKKQI